MKEVYNTSSIRRQKTSVSGKLLIIAFSVISVISRFILNVIILIMWIKNKGQIYTRVR